MFGFPVLEGFNLQVAAGQYNEVAFRGLDYVIAEAGKAGVKLIIAFMNNWNYNPLQTDWKYALELSLRACMSCLLWQQCWVAARHRLMPVLAVMSFSILAAVDMCGSP